MAAPMLEGLKPLQKRLDALKGKAGQRIEKAAVLSGLNVFGGAIKKGVDPQIKQVRKVVRSRFKKGRKRVVAKVGFGVGPRNIKAVGKERPEGRPGVGIGANNVHWWFMGTKDRTTRSGASRGAMPAQQPGMVPRAYATNKAAAFKKMVDTARKRLDKEAAKLRKVK